ncbi:MAG: murein DD-endopeptidase MepM/ murein hydrolase activator NlpD [Saprospiraceae bacterium]
MKKHLSDIFLASIILVLGSACWYFYTTNNSFNPEDDITSIELKEEAPVFRYGYDISNHTYEDYKIMRNTFMSDILMGHGIDFSKILDLEKAAQDVYSLRKIAAGKNITFVKEDECGPPKSFVYRPNRLDYIVYEFDQDVKVSRYELPYEVCIEQASGIVEYTLSDAMFDIGLDMNLIDKMEDALAQVSFFTSQKGDQFKLVYERIYIDGKPNGSGKILSAAYKYKSGDKEVYGFHYTNEHYAGYYDYAGTPNKKTFLRAPVRASRISSGFNPNRFHPVLKRRRAHLGTDYAAATGTPIMAVANGVVTKRAYTKGNGNYVKIKHDNIYQTQYLHMSRFGSGIRPGVRVSQGQTIGYVGQTGLATGPHVCFRFWKNGRQINHRTENFPPLDPMVQEELPAFYEVRDILFDDLLKVPYIGKDVSFAGMAD